MVIRKAKTSELKAVKKLLDSTPEMDSESDTFSLAYIDRVLKKGILLVAEEKGFIVGVCFGNYNSKENWADLLGLVVKPQWRGRGIGEMMVREFEKIVKSNKIKTIDLYSDKLRQKLFKKLGYSQGRTYISFRKKF